MSRNRLVTYNLNPCFIPHKKFQNKESRALKIFLSEEKLANRELMIDVSNKNFTNRELPIDMAANFSVNREFPIDTISIIPNECELPTFYSII